MSNKLTIDQRVSASLALQRYIRAVERFESANTELQEASLAVRQNVPEDSRFVANIQHQMYLVLTDDEGNFDIQTVDSL
jgi:hypothetical protein